MGWFIGYDKHWDRDIGYSVPAVCDHPDCNAKIDRGLSYVCCNSIPYGGNGCGLYFCEHHRIGEDGKCERCAADDTPYLPKPDTAEWINHKLYDASWSEWLTENPEFVAKHGTTED